MLGPFVLLLATAGGCAWCGDQDSGQVEGTSVESPRRAGFVSGRITDAQGRPVRGARVLLFALPPVHYTHEVSTGVAGTYLITKVPYGHFMVAASALGHAATTVTMEVKDFDTRADVALTGEP